ncbi:MAG: ABC transporter ATP-binding protein [Candidatus Poribacteria bacterium]|nr:ABC transporter ATP-binding protein [Candidatus Poribacteria bacterium]MDE0502476.1 ABC transporter ATP-binding protein [Candidatus Poribacteria bacterium]
MRSSDAVHKPLIRISGLRKIYWEGDQNHTVLDGITEEFYGGEFVCLHGKSGSGKSSLLNLIAGIDAPSDGDILIQTPDDEIALNRLTERERTLFRRDHIGFVFQFFNLIPTLTVVENVSLPLNLMGKRDAHKSAASLLDAVGLGERTNTYPDKLSGGEQQRVAIARALVHNPRFLLADEPTGNLDAETGESVLSLLLRLTRAAGKTLVMATHATEIAERADRVFHIDGGKLNLQKG